MLFRSLVLLVFVFPFCLSANPKLKKTQADENLFSQNLKRQSLDVAPDEIRVLLSEPKRKISLKLSGVNVVYPSKKKLWNSVKLIKTAKGWFLNQGQNWIACSSKQPLFIDGNVSIGGFQNIKKLAVHCLNKKAQLVAYLSVETYLAGVLGSEMPVSWPKEALKAQAVASRGYALWKKAVFKKKNYDLRATVLDQVFRSPSSRDVNAKEMAKVKQVLQETGREVLVTGSGRLVKAYFHSDCGGKTETAANVWGKQTTANTSTRDSFCSFRKSNKWKMSWERNDLEKLFKSKLLVPGDWKLISMHPHSDGASGRANQVDLFFGLGKFKRVSGDKLRSILGYSNLKSTYFNVKKQGEKIVFTGRGHGHGVGLCQWGTRSLAKKGKGYHDILKHYFPKAYFKVLTPVKQSLATQ